MGPYALRICYHRSTSIWFSTWFILRLSERPLSGLEVRRLLLLYLYLMCPSRLASSLNGFFLFLKGVFQAPWIFYCSGSSAVYYLESPKGSNLEVLLRYFRAIYLRFRRLIYSGVSDLVSTLLLFVSEVFRGSSEVVWKTWGVLPVRLILRTRIDFIDVLPIVSVSPRPFVTCYLGFYNVLRRTDLRLQEIHHEVLYLTSGVTVSWRRRSRGIFFLDLWRASSNGRLYSYSERKERSI